MRESASPASRSRAAPQKRTDTQDRPDWLRRPYTRTIARELRTTAQLTCSFDDVRAQWREVCSAYTFSPARLAGRDVLPCEGALPNAVRATVDGLVSQLKAVKQELLAHLSTLARALAATAVLPVTASASAEELPAWAKDLMGRDGVSTANANAQTQSGTESGEEAAATRAYLHAVWLARRVWVWSICFASITMDLELLSGSVSVAAELFFGQPFATAATPRSDGAATTEQLDDLVVHSPYNMHGALSETLLHATVARSPTERCAVLAITDVSDTTPQMHDEEARELRFFFGAARLPEVHSTTSACETAAAHADPCARTSADAGATSPLPAASLRDAFWVHAVALVYSVVARDDVSAARLLALFEAATLCFSADAAPSTTDGVGAVCKAPSAPPPHRGTPLQVATSVVLLVAKALVVEDYRAAQLVLSGAGWGGRTVERESVQGGSLASLGELCPQGVLLSLVTRLLAEHVVRRRWTEQGLGQAFRPIEPAVDGAAASSRGQHSQRLASALTRSGADSRVDEATLVEGTCRLCHAVQIAALQGMGGDWPLPPSLLVGTFS
ncbi:hypothetical protein NESM_000196800 [Novymonas esmeraldas]|uniref:Uncharacterized protein n=1 Tax=Novymonas esmeraldas TaxID=1808958 RepID=A0AAW0F597_9TRYP